MTHTIRRIVPLSLEDPRANSVRRARCVRRTDASGAGTVILATIRTCVDFQRASRGWSLPRRSLASTNSRFATVRDDRVPIR